MVWWYPPKLYSNFRHKFAKKIGNDLLEKFEFLSVIKFRSLKINQVIIFKRENRFVYLPLRTGKTRLGPE